MYVESAFALTPARRFEKLMLSLVQLMPVVADRRVAIGARVKS
jgi:hypothetical protein